MLAVSKSREFQATIDDGKNLYFKLFVLACRVVSWIEFGCQFEYSEHLLDNQEQGSTILPEKMLKSQHGLKKFLLVDRRGMPRRLRSES